MPWTTMYTVTVRLINSVDWWKAAAIVGMAGKYMLAVSGLWSTTMSILIGRLLENSSHLNSAAKAVTATMNHFSRAV